MKPQPPHDRAEMLHQQRKQAAKDETERRIDEAELKLACLKLFCKGLFFQLIGVICGVLFTLFIEHMIKFS